MKKYKPLTGVPSRPTLSQQTNINKMTNWQNSQWLRSGADPKDTEKFANLKKTT